MKLSVGHWMPRASVSVLEDQSVLEVGGVPDVQGAIEEDSVADAQSLIEVASVVDALPVAWQLSSSTRSARSAVLSSVRRLSRRQPRRSTRDEAVSHRFAQ